MLNNGHSNTYHHKNHISKFVELSELVVFSMIHLGDIAKEVGLSVLLMPQFVASRVCFVLELHFKCPSPLYLFFESELYHDDFDNHWLLWSQ